MGNKLYTFIRPVWGLILALEVASCSLVREDRTDCPCELTVEILGQPAYPVSLSLTGEGFREEWEIPRDTVLRLSVPSPGVQLLALAGTSPPQGHTIHIPEGCDCPPLYLHTEWVETVKDSARVAVHLEKHFCTLSLLVEGSSGNGNPLQAGVRGCVEGLTLEGEPLKGSFTCRLDPGDSIRLPRQDPEEELWLDICMPEGVVRSFALGNYMLEAGYDWTAPSLRDLSLEVKLSVTHLTFHTGRWTTNIPIKLEI